MTTHIIRNSCSTLAVSQHLRSSCGSTSTTPSPTLVNLQAKELTAEPKNILVLYWFYPSIKLSSGSLGVQQRSNKPRHHHVCHLFLQQNQYCISMRSHHQFRSSSPSCLANHTSFIQVWHFECVYMCVCVCTSVCVGEREL